jgi:outer membrane protein TolC
MERRAALRQKESLLSLRMMDATLQLSIVSSNALTGGHNNGNVERARQAAQKAAADYEDFMRDVTAHEINK